MNNPVLISPSVLTELRVRVPELVQDAAAGEWWDINIGDKCDLPGVLGRSILRAVNALQFVFGDIGLGLGNLNLGTNNKTLPLRLSSGRINNSAVVSPDGLSVIIILNEMASGKCQLMLLKLSRFPVPFEPAVLMARSIQNRNKKAYLVWGSIKETFETWIGASI